MRIARRIAQGKEWVSLVAKTDLLDVEDTPGYIVGDGPSPLLAREGHFQMWFLWAQVRLVEPRATPEILEAFFHESLAHPWAVLGLTMSRNHVWFWREETHLPFLRAASRHWDEFASVGPRYTTGSRLAKHLWKISNTVAHVLANRGLSVDVVRMPPEPGGLERYLDDVGIPRA